MHFLDLPLLPLACILSAECISLAQKGNQTAASKEETDEDFLLLGQQLSRLKEKKQMNIFLLPLHTLQPALKEEKR